MHGDAYDRVYRRRIALAPYEDRLGSFAGLNTEFIAISCFFEYPWSRLSNHVPEHAAAFLFAAAGFCLGAVGRISEAITATKEAVVTARLTENWTQAVIAGMSLVDLKLTSGEVSDAITSAQDFWHLSDWSIRDYQQMVNQTGFANALHQAGRRSEAERHFLEAERLQTKATLDYPRLYLLPGFRYCDLMLATAERATWRCIFGAQREVPESEARSWGQTLDTVRVRATETQKWAGARQWRFGEFIDHLTLGRVALYAAILTHPVTQRDVMPAEGRMSGFLAVARDHLRRAVDGLFCTGFQDEIPPCLLSQAWLRFLTGARTGPESAQADLDEAWEIAERGPMRLHMADIHLYRARLFFREKHYPWESPAADLAAAEKLINDCGYHRRDEELADAKRAILGA
jgi:hypothetical protein